MFGIGTWELVVILALALIIHGPANLPKVAKSLGRGLASLRRSADEVKRELDIEGIRKEIEEDVGIEELKQMVDVRGEVRQALAELEDPLHPTDKAGEDKGKHEPAADGTPKDEPDSP